MKWWAVLLPVAIGLVLPGPARARPRIELSNAQRLTVDRGEIVTTVEETPDPVKTVTSVGVVRRPARDVYLLMTDYKNYPRIYNSIEKAEVEPSGGKVVIAHYLLKAPWPLDGRTISTRTWLDPERNAFRWERVKGSMRVYEGELVAESAGPTRCIVFYSAKVDPGYDWLPTWFVTWGQTYVLPSIIHAIRDTLGKRTGPYWEAGVGRPGFSQEP